VAALETAGLESRGEGYRYQTQVKHRSPYSCPIPALSSTISSRNHQRIPRLTASSSARFSVLSAFTRMRFDVPLEKLTRALCLPYHRGSSFRVLFASVGSHGNSFSLFLPAYLSISPFSLSFPSYLFVYRSIPDFSLAVHFRPFFPPSSSDFLCKRPQVDL